jgi:hypothetical protein
MRQDGLAVGAEKLMTVDVSTFFGAENSFSVNKPRHHDF